MALHMTLDVYAHRHAVLYCDMMCSTVQWNLTTPSAPVICHAESIVHVDAAMLADVTRKYISMGRINCFNFRGAAAGIVRRHHAKLMHGARDAGEPAPKTGPGGINPALIIDGPRPKRRLASLMNHGGDGDDGEGGPTGAAGPAAPGTGMGRGRGEPRMPRGMGRRGRRGGRGRGRLMAVADHARTVELYERRDGQDLRST